MPCLSETTSLPCVDTCMASESHALGHAHCLYMNLPWVLPHFLRLYLVICELKFMQALSSKPSPRWKAQNESYNE